MVIKIPLRAFQRALLHAKARAEGQVTDADLILTAAREAAGDRDLTLSPAERQPLKNLAYPILYGHSSGVASWEPAGATYMIDRGGRK